jgi:hypothetical protein
MKAFVKDHQGLFGMRCRDVEVPHFSALSGLRFAVQMQMCT